MWYVEVLVADAAYHKNEALTYSSDTELEAGRIVMVPLRSKTVLGVITRVVEKPAFSTKQLVTLPQLPPLPQPLLDLLSWLRGYYPAPLGMIVQLFLPNNLTKKPRTTSPLPQPVLKKMPPLTADQKNALGLITSPGLHLLHGNTGTGKTRIYQELAIRSFLSGKSTIILTPEIGLTSQLAEAFKTIFGDRVVVLHSGLTEVARQKTWQWLLEEAEPAVIVGARSALFAPVPKIGAIIIDEAHETSYKQDQAPYYQTAAVAAKLAELHNATLLLGSATPSVRDYYIAKAKGRPIIRMTQLAAGETNDVAIEIVDLKDRSKFTKSPHFSTPLLEAIHQKIAQQEQVLLFLNRRGTARVVFCERCGWQAVCPHCDLPLVYHGDHHLMRCHSCSFKGKAPGNCPECQRAEIVFKSVGTKAIADAIQRLFPTARVMRFDTDNSKNERLDIQYQAVHSGQVDIIVGTQTLAKGLDLPKLSLVGVLIADTTLYFPDFTAQERTYQLLTQVLGRIGRGHRQSRAIIQTYSPNSTIIAAAVTKNWDNFYNAELAERQRFLFPPFCYLLKLTCKRASADSSRKACETLLQKIRSQRYNVILEGPAPSFHQKVQNKFVWQLTVKARERKLLLKIIRDLPSGWSYDIDPTNLL